MVLKIVSRQDNWEGRGSVINNEYTPVIVDPAAAPLRQKASPLNPLVVATSFLVHDVNVIRFKIRNAIRGIWGQDGEPMLSRR